MNISITQEHRYGCGVACFAFVNDISYKQAVLLLGREMSVKNGWRPADLVRELKNQRHVYRNTYVRNKDFVAKNDGTIVLIEPSGSYPVGHYLVYYRGRWMDPWINLPLDNNLARAKSGYRASLPGKSMYALVPEEK